MSSPQQQQARWQPILTPTAEESTESLPQAEASAEADEFPTLETIISSSSSWETIDWDEVEATASDTDLAPPPKAQTYHRTPRKVH